MELVNVKDLFGSELEKIFDVNGKYSKLTIDDTEFLVERKFAYTTEVKRNALCFIGLNPSFVDTSMKDHLFYRLEKEGNEYSKYWKPFENISTELGLEWTHIDLLGLRETKQSKIWQLVSQEHGVDFILEQLNFSKKVLELSDPRIIVVSNTLSRLFLGYDVTPDEKHNVWMGYKFEFDDEIGTDRVKTEGPLFDKPIFFTSMLSGQRALDNGSEKRLIWHIKKVNEFLNVKDKY